MTIAERISETIWEGSLASGGGTIAGEAGRLTGSP